MKIRLLTIKYNLFKYFTWVWDVLFTFIDNTQARLWYKMEERRVDMYYELDYLKKNKDLEDYDSFEEVK